MSAHHEAQFDRAFADMRDAANREFQYERELTEADWGHLQILTSEFKELPDEPNIFTRRKLVRLVCTYAADAHMSGNIVHAQQAFDTLRYLEEHAPRMENIDKLAMHTCLALMANLVGKHVIAANSAEMTARFLHQAPELVQAYVWLMRGEVSYQQDRRRALLRALKLLKRNDRTTETLLLEYRTRGRLQELYRALDMRHRRRWHMNKNGKVEQELRLQRQLDEPAVSTARNGRLPKKPLLMLLELC